MSVTPGRFSEFMVKGAETEPDDANPPFVETPAGETTVALTQPIPAAQELTTATPSPQQNQQSITPDPLTVWPFIEGNTPAPGTTSKIPGKYVSWNGKTPLQIGLAGNNPIRSLWIPIAAGQAFAVYSGTTSGGAPLFSTTGSATGVLVIPDGNAVLTLIAKATFSETIPIFATSEVLQPTLQNNSSQYPLGASPIGGFTRVQLSGTGTAQSFNVPGLVASVNSYNIGQSVYLSGFGVLGVARQGYAVTLGLYDQDGNTSIGNGIGLSSGNDVQPFALPVAIPFGTFTKAGNEANFFIRSTFGDTVIGVMEVDVFVSGYVL